jgi:curved DNA-binding protein CbpA
MLTDLYAVLGVPATATAHAVRKAYRRRALELHPDLNPGDSTATERFKALGQAYATLSDPAQRAAYDQTRQTAPVLSHSSFWPAAARARTRAARVRWAVPVDFDAMPPDLATEDGVDAENDVDTVLSRSPRRSRYPRGYPGCEHTGDGVYPDEGNFDTDPAPHRTDEDYAAEGGVVDLHGDVWGGRR